MPYSNPSKINAVLVNKILCDWATPFLAHKILTNQPLQPNHQYFNNNLTMIS